MELEALTRFNQHDPGDTFDAEEADAKKWIKNKLAKKPSGKKNSKDEGEPEGKTTEAPVKDKAVKEPEKKK